jgi:hypothetical protein
MIFTRARGVLIAIIRGRTLADFPVFVMQKWYAFGFRRPFYEGSDPNGIRTRVTAVKGRCPGPLDDRVAKRGQYRNCHSFAQGKLPSSSNFGVRVGRRTAPWLRTGMKLVNQRRCARSCALMRAQYVTRVFHKALPRFAIAEKLGDRPLEKIGVPDLDRTLF